MKPFEEFVRNAQAPIEHLFQDHTFCDKSWCYAKNISESLHDAITNSVQTKCNAQHENETHLFDSQEQFRTDADDHESSTKGPIREFSYEDLEKQWVKALDLDSSIFEDDEGSDNDEFKPIDTDDGSSDEEVDELDPEVVDELNYEVAICDVLDDYNIERTVFADSELEDLKLKEKILLERGDRGYYRNKLDHENAYEEICKAMKPYLTRENLKMLHHPHTTQSNEALNKSVSAYAPKHKHFSTTKSLEARVGVAASIQIDGYHHLWQELYDKFTLNFDESISLGLSTMDKYKKRKRENAATKEGKNEIKEEYRQA